jgi:hypothetical protein
MTALYAALQLSPGGRMALKAIPALDLSLPELTSTSSTAQKNAARNAAATRTPELREWAASAVASLKADAAAPDAGDLASSKELDAFALAVKQCFTHLRRIDGRPCTHSYNLQLILENALGDLRAALSRNQDVLLPIVPLFLAWAADKTASRAANAGNAGAAAAEGSSSAHRQ